MYGFTTDQNVYAINTLLNKIKRMITWSFCTTPLVTLSIQSGIPNFEDIRLNAVLDAYAAVSDSSYPLENAKSKCRILLRSELKKMYMFSEEEDVISFTKIGSI